MVSWSALLIIFACAPPPEPDAARYARLVSMAAPTVEDIAECAALSSAELRGDCGLVTAQNAAASAGQPPETFCDRVDAPPWRSECYFVAAEAHNAQGDRARAAEMCRLAEHFTDDCAQHLWQKPLSALTFRSGSAAFAPRLDDARRLHQRWAPLLGEDTDFTDRFWRRYFEGGFERARNIDLRACEPLPDPDRRRCRDAGASLLSRRLLEATVVPRAYTALCAAAPTVAALVQAGPPQLRAASDPALDAVAAQFQDTHCIDGAPNPALTQPLPFDPAP